MNGDIVINLPVTTFEQWLDNYYSALQLTNTRNRKIRMKLLKAVIHAYETYPHSDDGAALKKVL